MIEVIKKSIPSLLTLCNLGLGIGALLLTSSGRTSDAALMIVIGMVLDGLDGRAARYFHAESEFGRELDSLSDVVTFGVAPTLILWHVVLSTMGAVGIAIAILFPVCGALRLARFNVAKKATHYFIGLPITAAGGILATLALYRDLLDPANVILPIGMVLLAVLMVSRAKYPNFKRIAFPRSAIVVVPLLAIAVYIIFRYQYAVVNRLIFVPLAMYAVYGVGRMLRHRRRLARDRKHEAESLEPELK